MNTFDSKYPNITNWIENYGWIELGQDDCCSSMVRVLDEGGMVWEGKTQYKNLDELWNCIYDLNPRCDSVASFDDKKFARRAMRVGLKPFH